MPCSIKSSRTRGLPYARQLPHVRRESAPDSTPPPYSRPSPPRSKQTLLLVLREEGRGFLGCRAPCAAPDFFAEAGELLALGRRQAGTTVRAIGLGRVTHNRRADGVRSRSRATAPTVLWSSSTKRTAWLRNSSSNCRRGRRPLLLSGIRDIVSGFRNVSTRSDHAHPRLQSVLRQHVFDDRNPDPCTRSTRRQCA